MISAIFCAAVLGAMPVSPVEISPSAELPPEVIYEAPRMVSPVRTVRPFTLGAELGWNGLGGAGIHLDYALHRNFSMDGALGVSTTGIKVGIGGRYNFLRSNLTPYAAAGVSLGSGTMRNEAVFSDAGKAVGFKMAPSPFAHIGAGLSYVNDGGFALMAGLGYAFLLRDNNLQITGTPSESASRQLHSATSSGPMASLMLGYAFKV